MLVNFSCPAYTDITMFGDVAIRLIEMMGHSGTVPSALGAEDVPAALEQLRAAVAANQSPPEQQESISGDDEEAPISLQLRAAPLLELLEAAKTAKCDVMWEPA